MHPNPAFRQEDTARNLAFARERGFGTLCINGPHGPQLSHVPFLLSAEGTQAELHLVRSNPIARMGAPAPAVLSVAGPDGYISPDWYGLQDQVPTWNYVAVHLRGVLRPAPEADLRAHLDRVSAHFETMLPAKQPWQTAKMTPQMLARMMRQILLFTLEIDDISGTWKLGQNKTQPARLGAADGVEAFTPGSETAVLSALMRGVDDS